MADLLLSRSRAIDLLTLADSYMCLFAYNIVGILRDGIRRASAPVTGRASSCRNSSSAGVSWAFGGGFGQTFAEQHVRTIVCCTHLSL